MAADVSEAGPSGQPPALTAAVCHGQGTAHTPQPHSQMEEERQARAGVATRPWAVCRGSRSCGGSQWISLPPFANSVLTHCHRPGSGVSGLVVWGKLPQAQGSGLRCHSPLWVGPVMHLICLQAWVQTPTLQTGAQVFWHRCPMHRILLHRACCAQGRGPCLLAEEDDAPLRPKELHVPMAR